MFDDAVSEERGRQADHDQNDNGLGVNLRGRGTSTGKCSLSRRRDVLQIGGVDMVFTVISAHTPRLNRDCGRSKVVGGHERREQHGKQPFCEQISAIEDW